MARITSSSDGLPKHFTSAMKTLFDIMDDQNTGFIKFSDIEDRWQDDGAQGLPKGILESLKKVAPPNGMLSFERFCAGLKICLLHIRVDNDAKKQESQPIRPPSAPTLVTEDETKAAWTSPNTATIRPNNVISQQRTLSMPQLLPGRKERSSQFESVNSRNCQDPKMFKTYSLSKPRPNPVPDGRTPNSDRNFDKSEIRTALQNWQMSLLMGDDKCIDKRQSPDKYPNESKSLLRQVGNSEDEKVVELQNNYIDIETKKALNRRREPRRHTLQNGIDYNMMKRMKQIEQEKDVLLQGLAAVDKTRVWYLRQISMTQDKMKHLGQMGSHMEQTEAQQERLELQRARVLEVNRHLAALISSWERGGLSFHIFLSSGAQLNQNIVSRLKQQNQKLTEEINKKTQRIAILEQEKDSLMREIRQSGMIQSRRSIMQQHNQTFII